MTKTFPNMLTGVVPSDAAQGPGCSLLHPGVEVLQAEDQGVHPPAVHHGLGQLGRVFGDGSQHEASSFLIKPLKDTDSETKAPKQEVRF